MNKPTSSKILVVDDSKFNRTVISKTLNEINMNVITANHGGEALIKLQESRFDLIITDTVMPVMDGISLIKEIKQQYSEIFIPIILMTGNDDQNIKITSLNIGADDFLSKPIDQKELVARVFSLLRLKKTHDLLFEKNSLIERELVVAKKIQSKIIPEDFSYIEYPNVSGYYSPIEDIGGDFYDCYSLPNGKTGFLISDVTGHGIPAALIVTMSKMLFSIYANKIFSPKKMLTKVNQEICESLTDDQYITSFYCIYDHESGKLKFSNAGHVHPLLYKRNINKVYRLINDDGFFLGVVKSTVYDQKVVKIDKGDRLLLYTDGVTELKNNDNEEYGEKRLIQFLLSNCNSYRNYFCKKLYKSVMNHSQKNQRLDDIAFLNIEF